MFEHVQRTDLLDALLVLNVGVCVWYWYCRYGLADGVFLALQVSLHYVPSVCIFPLSVNAM
jgi:hypothetical protein